MKKWITKLMCLVFATMILFGSIPIQAKTKGTPIQESRVKKDIVKRTISVTETYGTVRYKISFKANVARERYYIGKKLVQTKYDGIKKITSKPKYTMVSTGNINSDLWRALKKNKITGPIIKKYGISFPKIFKCRMKKVTINKGFTSNGYINPSIKAKYQISIKIKTKIIVLNPKGNLYNYIFFNRDEDDPFQPIYYDYLDAITSTTIKRNNFTIK